MRRYFKFLWIGIYSVIFSCILGCSSTANPANFAETYNQQRQVLVNSDANQRFSSGIKLNPAETKLAQKLLRLRLQMKAHYDSVGFFPPAQPFAKYKTHVATTKLFQLIRKMPKGAIHHLHPSAGADFNWLVDVITKDAKAYVYWAEPSNNHIKGEIQFFGNNDVVPKGFRSATELQNEDITFKEKLLIC